MRNWYTKWKHVMLMYKIYSVHYYSNWIKIFPSTSVRVCFCECVITIFKFKLKIAVTRYLFNAVLFHHDSFYFILYYTYIYCVISLVFSKNMLLPVNIRIDSQNSVYYVVFTIQWIDITFCNVFLTYVCPAPPYQNDEIFFTSIFNSQLAIIYKLLV